MAEERFQFSGNIKKWLAITAGIGLLVTVLGIILVSLGHHGADGGHGEHSSPLWLDRLWTAIWVNNIYFIGIALIGVFFVAFNYASMSGWSSAIKRVPEAFGSWLPFAGILALVVFLVAKHTLFHWTHDDVDAIVLGKRAYLNVPFFTARLILYFVLWYMMYRMIRKKSLEEDLHGGTEYYQKMRKYSVFFLIIFAITSSTSSWDWAMSVDPHWFSTLFGWYIFAGWFVAGLATIALITVGLKDNGYLSIVNANHLHDLGKYIFAFSIFWMYLWFSQYMLIYYANIPEETLHYYERLNNSTYAAMFYLNIILNFFFPFLLLMTRDSKRHAIFLKIVGVVVLIGQWLNLYLLIAPATVGAGGAIGTLELGVTMIFGSAFLFVVFGALAKAPLVAKNHPMLEESLHYHT